jgi:DNA-binding transcriptional LysR family regulator
MRSPINLDLLRLFVAAADLAGIAAAARKVDCSPSLATRRIAELERTLKVRLFERTTRRIKLTAAGAVALRWARSTLESFEQVSDDLTSLIERPSGTIRLAVNLYTATAFLPGLLQRFCKRYPEIQLSVTTTDSAVRLVEGGFDVAIHSGSIPESGVVGVRLREFRRVVCASPDYLSRRGVPQKPEDLANHECIVYSTKEPQNWFFRRGKRVVGQPIRSYIEADTYIVLVELARAGLGVARLGHDVLKDDLDSGRLVEVLPDYKSVYSTGEYPGLWIVYPNRRVLYRTRVLIDFLVKELEQR